MTVLPRQPKLRHPIVGPGLAASLRCAAVSVMLVFAATIGRHEAAAQIRAPEQGGLTRSLGQPGPWDLHVGVGAGAVFTNEGSNPLNATVHAGVYRDLLKLPLMLVGTEVNAYAGARGSKFDWGFRAQLASPFLRLGLGADYNGFDDRTDFVLSLNHPVRRGGLFGFGSSVRIDYLPGRDHSFSINYQLPVGRTLPMGRTRPKEDAVQLEVPDANPVAYAPEASMQTALENVALSARWIQRLGVPYMEHSGWSGDAPVSDFVQDLEELRAHLVGTDVRYPNGRSFADETAFYHSEVQRAFSIAVSGRELVLGEATATGREVARQARQILLDEVLLPYDRLLGQRKESDTVLDFGTRARGIFVRWLHAGSPVRQDRIDAALWVFTQLLATVEESRRWAHDEWDDSRFVWLPLQYALTPDQHDSQAELDALIARAVERPFTDRNRVSYVINEQFNFQLSRTIREAEDYHVLWVHDFPGQNEGGDPDAVSYSTVLNSYLRALIDRVEAYDQTGILPVYMIFIDEWFYALRDARLWMSLLEDPMGHDIDLPSDFEEWEDAIAEAQEELRQAVAGSRLLAAEAAQYGDDWLRNRIRVHVSITNRADPSFWNRQILPFVGIPDNVMRDHRKVVFYDITEDDPYRGRALYTGMGVGEHYASVNWEDRAVMLQGPAALGLKTAARELLLTQGIPEDKIPFHLQRRPPPLNPPPPPSTATPWAGDSRVLELHNQTGYNAKSVNVAKAILYTLMPPGSLIETPDSLWNSGFWGSILVGAALRGARVLIIAPAARNAPSWGFGQMARTKEILIRLIAAQQILGTEIEAAGGLLKTGVYAPTTPVTDIGAKLDAFVRTYEEEPFFRDLLPLHPSILPLLYEVQAGLDDALPSPAEQFDEDNGTPKLHLKANFVASATAWNSVMSSPELGAYFRIWMEDRVAQLRDRALALEAPGYAPERMLEAALPTLMEREAALPPAEREHVMFYLMLGSANQNYRSMVMDGEVAVLLGGWSSLVGVVDFLSLAGQSVWVDDLDELAELLPEYGALTRTIGQWIKIVL